MGWPYLHWSECHTMTNRPVFFKVGTNGLAKVTVDPSVTLWQTVRFVEGGQMSWPNLQWIGVSDSDKQSGFVAGGQMSWTNLRWVGMSHSDKLSGFWGWEQMGWPYLHWSECHTLTNCPVFDGGNKWAGHICTGLSVTLWQTVRFYEGGQTIYVLWVGTS